MYPVLLAVGAAMSAAAAGTAMAANEKTKAAMRNAVDAELERQRGYQKQGQAVLAESMSQSTRAGAEETMEASAKERKGAYDEAQAQKMAQYGPTDRAQTPETVAGREMKQEQSDITRAAYMAGYDWITKQRIKDIMASRKLGVMNVLASESAGLLPYDLQGAQASQQGLRSASSVLGGVGSLVGTAGALGVGPSFGGSGLEKTATAAEADTSGRLEQLWATR